MSSFSILGWRVDPVRVVYISRRDLWRHRKTIWNWTRKFVEAVYRKKTGKAKVPENIQTGFCDFIEPRVLENYKKPK